MTDQELITLRRDKWHTNGMPVASGEDARAFLDSVGICLMYPLTPPVLLPSFVAAVVGDDRGLPTYKQAFADARAKRANELVRRLVVDRAAFESNFFAENSLLLAFHVFPYFYALLAARTPGSRREEVSQLAKLAGSIIEKDGPQTREMLRERLGSELSIAAVERALGELWMRLRIVPLEESGRQTWESVERWAPEAVKQASRLPVGVALSALISQYIHAVVAAEPREIEEFFSHLAPRSKVREAVKALLAARELSFVNIGHRSLVQFSPEPARRDPPEPRRPKKNSEKRRA